MANATKCPGCETLHPGPRPDPEIAEALNKANGSAIRVVDERDALMLLGGLVRKIAAEIEGYCVTCRYARAQQAITQATKPCIDRITARLRVGLRLVSDGFDSAELGRPA
jgi:hypothetical protein